jgi:hypothetical protein
MRKGERLDLKDTDQGRVQQESKSATYKRRLALALLGSLSLDLGDVDGLIVGRRRCRGSRGSGWCGRRSSGCRRGDSR